MKKVISLSVILALTLPGLAMAKPGDVYIYPAGGQSDEQLDRDRYECYVWASRESGFNPSEAEVRPEGRLVRVPVENPKKGAAVAGAIIGAIAGVAVADSGRGAAAGAVAGTIVGATVESEGRKQAEEAARERADEIAARESDVAQRNADYRRAFSACLEGRGYVVR